MEKPKSQIGKIITGIGASFMLLGCVTLSLLSVYLLYRSICGFSERYAADNVIKSGLQSPSSYKSVEYHVLWEGKDSVTGASAQIYKVEFDAANAYGAMLRGCDIVAFYGGLLGGYDHNENFSLSPCSVGGTTEDDIIKMAVGLNHFVK